MPPRAFIDAVACAESGDDLWRLTRIEPTDEAFYSEEELLPAELDAIFDRVRAFTRPHDVAEGIALACRATATHPGRQLLDRDEVGEKDALAAVLDGRVAEILEASRSPHAIVRAAALHALGCCRVDIDGGQRVQEAALDDPDETVIASALLAVAARARRGEHDAVTFAAELGRQRLAHASWLVRLTAVAALASAGETLRRDALAVLLDALAEPQMLPTAWGWRWHAHDERGDILAVRILRRASVEPELRAPLAAALARLAAPGPVHLVPETAMRLAFGEPREEPRRGVTLEDLDEAQRHALATLGEEDAVMIHALGLHLAEDVAPLLAGAVGPWRPIAIVRAGTTRHWHLWRIWREAIAGDLDPAEAANLVTSALEPDELLAALCDPRRVVSISVSGFDVIERERDVAVLRAMFEALVERGVDLAALAVARTKPHDDTALALAILVGFREKPNAHPPELDDIIAKGLALLRDAEIDGLLAHLDAGRARSLRIKTVEALVELLAFELAATRLHAAADDDVECLLDGIGIAERGAAAAWSRGEHGPALALLRLAHEGWVVCASMSTSGAEGNQRMLDVHRVAGQIAAWERQA